jgi:hypothetical protein
LKTNGTAHEPRNVVGDARENKILEESLQVGCGVLLRSLQPLQLIVGVEGTEPHISVNSQGVLLGVAAVSGITSWYHIQAKKEECEALEKENRLLRDRTDTMSMRVRVRTMVGRSRQIYDGKVSVSCRVVLMMSVQSVRKLKNVHAQANRENLVLQERMALVEERVCTDATLLNTLVNTIIRRICHGGTEREGNTFYQFIRIRRMN